tara:strand:- start:8445 stop:9302 length:858 start_codon:yes stop_codon:yes gene_type:complete
MEIKKDKNPYVFQVDSEIVKNVYNSQDNYLISYNEKCSNKNTCAIYFSSNDIYFPNTQEVFEQRIIEKDFYEWYGTRITNAYKHILVRDVHKQWYLSGINKEINSPESLLNFFITETKGYSILTVGSSAGGYAAVLYGSMLKAKKAIVFNAQFEIKTLLDSSNSSTDPFIFRYKNLPVSKYYDIKPFINKSTKVFYFYSLGSKWDAEQHEHVKDVQSINVIPFSTNHHGIPFLKFALNVVINLEGYKLTKFIKSKNNPIVFTIRMIGLVKTFQGAKKLLLHKYKK